MELDYIRKAKQLIETFEVDCHNVVVNILANTLESAQNGDITSAEDSILQDIVYLARECLKMCFASVESDLYSQNNSLKSHSVERREITTMLGHVVFKIIHRYN